MMNGSNYSLSDIAAATGSNNRANDMWGGDGFSLIWLVLIFAIFGWGGFGGWGGGFGGNGANGAGFQGWATRADINEGFALNDIQNGINYCFRRRRRNRPCCYYLYRAKRLGGTNEQTGSVSRYYSKDG